MKPSACVCLLAAAFAALPARAASRADAVREDARALDAAAAASPVLQSETLAALSADVKALVRERPEAARAGASVRADADLLRGELQRSPKPVPERIRALAARALELAGGAAAPVAPAGSAGSAAAPVRPEGREAAALDAFHRRAAAMSAAMTSSGFGASAEPAAVPLPRPRDAVREPKPRFSARNSELQEALNVSLRAARRRTIAADGLFGPGTEKAVAWLQAKKGLPVTGVIDRATEAAILAGQYYAGKPSDFEPNWKATTIKGTMATVYTPFLAKTKKEKRMEGSHLDRHDQMLCTLERYLAGTCPYVSVAIDPRLGVPNGTPLLIPEISALVGREVEFRIVDTGSPKRFKGTGHVDIATDSNQTRGYGRAISGGSMTLVLPRGLRPSL